MRELFVVYLKGFSMGAADVVPGVSGGTIALILGIYDRLIGAITALDPRELRVLRRVHEPDGRAALVDATKQMDVPFLLALGLGVATAIVTLSRVMHHAAETYPVPTYGFFFGLIVASAIVLYRQVDVLAWRRAPPTILGVETGGVRAPVPNRRLALGIVGAALAFVVTGFTEGNGPQSPAFIFLAGAIAVCAMVLPGVSGAFFLLVLGQYEYLTGTLSEFVDDVVGLLAGGSLEAVLETGTTVLLFCLGAAVGLVTMAHLVKRALDRYRAATLTFLVSLMVGALRLPYVRIGDALGESPFGSLEVAVVAGFVGALAVLVVDRFTDEIEYETDESPNPI